MSETEKRCDPEASLTASQGGAPSQVYLNLAQLALLDAIADGLQVGDATGPEARIIGECSEASWIAWDAQAKAWTLTDKGWSAIAQRGGAQA